MSAVIGIFGGTFAPIHHGHLRLALELRERLGLDEVRIVPCGTPPHRAAPSLPAQRRVDWVRLAVGDEPGLVVDDSELRRHGHSYTADTLRALREEIGETPMCLLLGDDAANQLHTWHRWTELIERAHLVFAERPFEPLTPAPQVLDLLRGRRAHSAAELRAQPAGCWLSYSIPPLAISSTRIRGLLKAGRSIRGLVPEAVIHDMTPADVEALTLDEEPAVD